MVIYNRYEWIILMHFPKFTFLKWTIILGFLFTIWKVGKEVDVQFHWVWNHFPVSMHQNMIFKYIIEFVIYEYDCHI
jgi:hypothetical protein